MLDCLLINPLATTKNWHTHFIRDWCGGENVASLIFPPLELAQTASLLRKNGFDVGIIDASALHLPHREVVLMVKQHKPDWVGIPSAWASIGDDIHLATLIKESLPKTKIIFYGVNVTAEPVLALDSGIVDYAILGEPEMAFLDIIQGRLDKNVAFRENGKIRTKEIVQLGELDELPFPARDLLPNSYYVSPFTKTNPFTFMYTSRGCCYQCIFCPASIWYSHKVRYRSIGNVISEIKEIADKYKIRDIIFRDPSMTIKREHIFCLCEEIVKNNYRINWRCFSHANDIDEELLRLMKRAGCYQISYGFETASQQILDISQKMLTTETALKASRMTKKAGIEVSGSFMLGLPGETEKTINETILFSKQLNLDYAQFQFAVPVPGTKLYDFSYKDKYTTPINTNMEKCSWDDWEEMLKSDCDLSATLRNGLRMAYRSFYVRPGYIFSQLIKIRNSRQLFLKLGTIYALIKRRFMI